MKRRLAAIVIAATLLVAGPAQANTSASDSWSCSGSNEAYGALYVRNLNTTSSKWLGTNAITFTLYRSSTAVAPIPWSVDNSLRLPTSGRYIAPGAIVLLGFTDHSGFNGYFKGTATTSSAYGATFHMTVQGRCN